jgi:hypothetical protein
MDKVWHELNQAATTVGVTVVHGDCPTGADAYANMWGHIQPDVTIEKHPADWETHGRAAGPIRNRKMVELGADVCLAFIKNNSPGASGTAQMAQEAGIKTLIFRS